MSELHCEHFNTYLELILWRNKEWEKGNRIKASKIQKAMDNLKKNFNDHRRKKYGN